MARQVKVIDVAITVMQHLKIQSEESRKPHGKVAGWIAIAVNDFIALSK